MLDASVLELYNRRDWVGLFRLLGPGWMKGNLETITELTSRGFNPDPARYRAELDKAGRNEAGFVGIDVPRLEVTMRAVLQKRAGVSWEKFKETYHVHLAPLNGKGNQIEEIAGYFGVSDSAAGLDSAAVKWAGRPLPAVAPTAMAGFFKALEQGAKDQVPDDLVTQLGAKVNADPMSFQLGYYEGYVSGMLTGLKELLEVLYKSGKVSDAVATIVVPPLLLYRGGKALLELLTKEAEDDLTKREPDNLVRVAKLIAATARGIRDKPEDYVAPVQDIGYILGEFAGKWLTGEIAGKSSRELGASAGYIVGRACCEIALQILIEVTTAGAANAARAASTAGKGTRFGIEISGLAQRLKAVLARTKGLQRFFIELARDERGMVVLAERVLSPPTRPGMRVLVVGPETEAEFAYARTVNLNGGKSIAVNPVKTPAADRFAASGGEFVQGKIETLPKDAPFDFIREDFPYPTGSYIDMASASERITRLKSGGSWVVTTEKADFADALETAATLQGAKTMRREIPLAHEATPTSEHPRDALRIILVILK